MPARVIPFSVGGRGYGPARVIANRDDLVSPIEELLAEALEGSDLAADVVWHARRIQTALASGNAAIIAQYADALEDLGLRRGNQAQAAAAIARARIAELTRTCPDEAGQRARGHGTAA